MIDYIKSDLYRCCGSTSFLCFLKELITNKGFNYLFWLRCCQHGRVMKAVALPVYWLKRNYGGINIGRRCKIGYGLYLGHNGPVIISDSAVIGNNVNLSQFTTIGSNNGQAAEIGDNVYIGPQVCIVEHVTIGNNATIGAGSVVTKDIPENATAAGNYARVLNYENPGRYVGNRWIKNISQS